MTDHAYSLEINNHMRAIHRFQFANLTGRDCLENHQGRATNSVKHRQILKLVNVFSWRHDRSDTTSWMTETNGHIWGGQTISVLDIGDLFLDPNPRVGHQVLKCPTLCSTQRSAIPRRRTTVKWCSKKKWSCLWLNKKPGKNHICLLFSWSWIRKTGQLMSFSPWLFRDISSMSLVKKRISEMSQGSSACPQNQTVCTTKVPGMGNRPLDRPHPPQHLLYAPKPYCNSSVSNRKMAKLEEFPSRDSDDPPTPAVPPRRYGMKN